MAATAGLAGLLLLSVAYYFLWPHRHRSTESVSSPPRSTGSSEAKPSPLSQAPAVQPLKPGEHIGPPPAPAMPVEQTPQSLAAMIQALANQQPGSAVRVTNVKHDGGGRCHGTLVFTLNDFRFECPDNGRETFRIGRGEVGQVHKNGVQVWRSDKGKKLGRRYHFSMVGRGKDLVRDAFEEWMRLRPS